MPTGPLTNADAYAQGISRATLRSSFRPLFHGIHVAREVPVDVSVRCHAAVPLLIDGAAFTGLTAVQLLGLPLPRVVGRRPTPIEAAVPSLTDRPRRQGLTVRRRMLEPADLTTVSGLVVTTAARTFVDLAEMFDEAYLVVVGDAILRMRLATPATLAAATAHARGRRGVVTARRALPRLDARSKSPAESELRVRIEDAGMPRPTPNADIVDDLGCWIATTDLLCEEAKVAIEYDGDRHRDKKQFERDLARDQLLAHAGYHVLRAGSRDLRPNATLFYDTLRRLLNERSPNGRG